MYFKSITALRSLTYVKGTNIGF